MTTRALLRQMILEDGDITDIIPAERWLSSSSLNDDNAPERPFAVIRWGVSNFGMADVNRGTATIWIHDEQGDYGTIDDVLKRLRAILDHREHVADEDGNEIMSCEWAGNSGDLYDPGFRTIAKNATFNIVGKGV